MPQVRQVAPGLVSAQVNSLREGISDPGNKWALCLTANEEGERFFRKYETYCVCQRRACDNKVPRLDRRMSGAKSSRTGLI